MDDLLKFALENGMLDLAYVQEQANMIRREKTLEQHKYEIWQDKNGKWCTYLPDKEKGRVLKRRNTRREIENLVIATVKDKETNPTLGELFNEWNDRKLELQKIVHSTHHRNRQIFDRHFDEIKNEKIKDIEINDISDFLEEQIPEHNLTAKAFSNLKSVVRGMFKYAKRKKYIDFNIEEAFDNIDTTDADFRKTIKESEEEVFDDIEMAKVILHLKHRPDSMNMGIALMFATGLRVGELCTLKWSDWDGMTIKVRRTETRVKDEETGKTDYLIKEFPKTAAGVRNVIVPETCRWILEQQRMNCPFGEFMFMKDGERLRAYSFRKRLKYVCRDTGCVHKSPHKIRKTYGSILLDNNIDLRLITDQMGHTDIRCTENHYHRNRKTLEKKSQIISSIPEFKNA